MHVFSCYLKGMWKGFAVSGTRKRAGPDKKTDGFSRTGQQFAGIAVQQTAAKAVTYQPGSRLTNKTTIL